MSKLPLHMGATGPDFRAILAAVCALPRLRQERPASLSIDNDDVDVGEDWLETWAARTQVLFVADWTPDAVDLNNQCIVFYHPRSGVEASISAFFSRPEEILSLMATWPVEVVSLGSPHSWHEQGYRGHYLGRGHILENWGCVFKGRGHERLVSRRWLEFGPWRVLRGPEDTTLVQFHDLEADADTALAQARPAHDRMGFSDTGGFLQSGHVYSREVAGLYTEAERKLEIMVHGRPVSQREMLDACAVRATRDPARPVERVAFVFIDEQDARAHLHELWLRELECWTFVGGQRVRLDVDHHPSPAPLAWVRALDAAAAR